MSRAQELADKAAGLLSELEDTWQELSEIARDDGDSMVKSVMQSATKALRKFHRLAWWACRIAGLNEGQGK